MKVALPVWNDRVAPVFDNSRIWLMMDISNKSKKITEKKTFQSRDADGKVDELLEQGIEHLICGAIPKRIEVMLIQAGCVVSSFVAGDVINVIDEFSGGDIKNKKFKMPGCKRRGKGCCVNDRKREYRHYRKS